MVPNWLFSARDVKGGTSDSPSLPATLIFLAGTKVSRFCPGLDDAGVEEIDLSGNET